MAASTYHLSLESRNQFAFEVNQRLDKVLIPNKQNCEPIISALEALLKNESLSVDTNELQDRVSGIKKLIQHPENYVTNKNDEQEFKEIVVEQVRRRINEIKAEQSTDSFFPYPSLADQGKTWSLAICQENLTLPLALAFGNIENELEILQDLARFGNSDALFILANHFEIGAHVPKNDKLAFDYFNAAAKQGHPGAQYKLGSFYCDGIAVDRDLKMAFQLYKISADNNYPPALLGLAMFYEFGDVVELNHEMAFMYCKQAADMNHPPALVSLGSYYEKGIGVPADPFRAYATYETALDIRMINGERYPGARIHVGLCLLRGVGVEPDRKNAAKQFRHAAHRGDALARYYLGVYYATGEPTKKNKKAAVRCYQIAAEAGQNLARIALGECYQTGRGIKKNLVKARAWLDRAIPEGGGEAQFDLADCLGDIGREIGNRAKKISMQIYELQTVYNDKREVSSAEESAIIANMERDRKRLSRLRVKFSENFNEMFQLLQSAAEKGHTFAQSALLQLDGDPEQIREKMFQTYIDLDAH